MNVPSNKQAMRRWFSKGVLTIVVLSAIAGIVMASMPKPIEVEAQAAILAPFTVSVDEDGRTRVKDRYVVSAPLAGSLARIDLRPGDRVEADAIVARVLPLPAPLLDPKTRAQSQARLAAAKAAHRRALVAESRSKAALEYVESKIESRRRLAKQGTIPKERLDQIELELKTKREDVASMGFSVRVARHEIEMTQAALGRFGSAKGEEEMTIKSPVAGVVLEVLRTHEGVVQAGAPLIEVGDPAALELVVDVLTTDAVRLKTGAKARILRWGGDGELAAHVRRVEPKAFTRMSSLGVEEQRVNVILDLDSPRTSWTSLMDGYRIEASITVWEAKEALKVPVSAVFRSKNAWSVFVVEAKTARLRPVELGQRNGFDAQILSGLKASETVILHPGEHIEDGTLVQAQP